MKIMNNAGRLLKASLERINKLPDKELSNLTEEIIRESTPERRDTTWGVVDKT